MFWTWTVASTDNVTENLLLYKENHMVYCVYIEEAQASILVKGQISHVYFVFILKRLINHIGYPNDHRNIDFKTKIYNHKSSNYTKLNTNVWKNTVTLHLKLLWWCISWLHGSDDWVTKRCDSQSTFAVVRPKPCITYATCYHYTSKHGTHGTYHRSSLIKSQHMYNISHKVYIWFCCALLCCGYIISSWGICVIIHWYPLFDVYMANQVTR